MESSLGYLSFYMQGSLNGEAYHFDAEGFNVIFFFSVLFFLISGIMDE